MSKAATVLAVCVIALIVLGASLTSEIQPIPALGPPPVSATTPTEFLLEHLHTVAAWIVSALTLGLGLWIQLGDNRPWMRWLGWAALVVVVGEGWSGTQNLLQSSPRAAGFIHALLAQILLSIVVAIAAGAAQSEHCDLVDDTGRPSFRSLAVSVPPLALLQILLGTAYRHGSMGVLWHIFNAMILAVLVMVLCMLVIRQFPEHRTLRPPAMSLAIATGAQVILGFATFTILIISSDNSLALVIVSVAHVLTGAVILAASILLAMRIRQYVRPKTTQPDDQIAPLPPAA